MKPLVSVIIPVFNGAQYIKGAVENVLMQTFKDVEIIVVDDGSTDNTKNEIANYIQSKTIKYIYQPNKGLAGARNTGVKNSAGKFLKFLDCDDLLYPQQLQRQTEHLKNTAGGIISITDYQLEFENRNRKTVQVRMGEGSQLARFIQSNLGPIHAYLIPRDLIEGVNGFDEKLSACEDTDMLLRILFKGASFQRLDHVGCCYRILGGSMSSSVEKHFRERCKVFEKLNQSMMPRLEEYPNDVITQLLSANIRFIHTCFARNIYPASCLPAAIKATKKIYLSRSSGLKKIFVKTAGFQIFSLLKYIKICSTDRNYRQSLLNTTAWRDENNYNSVTNELEYTPMVGKINFGDLGRLKPLGNDWGNKRGGPVDRYYIDEFMVKNSHHIKGAVLELEDGMYVKKYGNGKVSRGDILDIDPNNPLATVIADLTKADNIPSDNYDCIILTQVLQYIYDLKSALRHVYRMLKPGGILLITVPGVSHFVYKQYGDTWCWNFTELSVRKLLTEFFPKENIETEKHGNVLTAVSFLHGVGIHELKKEEYDYNDPDYQVIITAKAVKQA